MNQDLYFLPMLAKAYNSSDRVQALARTLREIEQIGTAEEYRTGFRQYLRFMAESYCAQVPTVRLEKSGILVAEFVPCQAVVEMRVPGIDPGDYAIRLSTGRVVWSGILNEADVVWAHAFPGAALPLAADTAEPTTLCTKELRLFQNEMILRVFPGIERGMIGIRIDRWRRPENKPE